MSLRAKWLGFKRDLLSGTLLENRPELRRYLALGLWSLLGLLCASVRLMNGISPFGTALVAQAGTGPAGIAALLGAAVGYVAFGGFDWGIRYVAACVLIFTVAFVFQGVSLYRKGWFMPLTAGLLCLVTAALNSYGLSSGTEAARSVMTEVLLT